MDEQREALREEFLPVPITTLFIGESAPIGGTFFYQENSILFKATRAAFGQEDKFLQFFVESGFYLDDLVLTPVNHLPGPERRRVCREWVPSLAKRLKKYKPLAIVTLKKTIHPMVLQAMRLADLACPVYSLPFPDQGNQRRFHTELIDIIPDLPTAPSKKKKDRK
jgi:hypothetical protein